MKKFAPLLFFFLITNLCSAKFTEGTIYFKNGRVEKGYIKSFLEDKFFDFSLVDKFENNFNLNDSKLKFKPTKDAEIVEYTIDEIDAVTIKTSDNTFETYRALYLRKIDKKGNATNGKNKIWLPIMIKGKINVYGFHYWISHKGEATEVGDAYYYSKEGDDFAYMPYNDLTLLNTKVNLVIIKHFYSYLFDDCPLSKDEINTAINIDSYNLPKEERKKYEAEYKQRYKELRKRGNSTLQERFETNLYELSNLIKKYNIGC